MKAFLIFLLIYLSLFFSIDILQKKVFAKVQWSRKATHITSGIVSYFLPVYMQKEYIILLSVFFVFMLAISKWKQLLSLHNVERKTLGEVFYPLSITIMAIFCLPKSIESFQLGILILAFSDGLAGIIGELLNFAPVKLFGNTKSIGGSIAFFIPTLILFFVFNPIGLPVVVIIAGAVVLTAIEFVLVHGTDNLILPLAVSLLHLFLLGR